MWNEETRAKIIWDTQWDFHLFILNRVQERSDEGKRGCVSDLVINMQQIVKASCLCACCEDGNRHGRVLLPRSHRCGPTQ